MKVFSLQEDAACFFKHLFAIVLGMFFLEQLETWIKRFIPADAALMEAGILLAVACNTRCARWGSSFLWLLIEWRMFFSAAVSLMAARATQSRSLSGVKADDRFACVHAGQTHTWMSKIASVYLVLCEIWICLCTASACHTQRYGYSSNTNKQLWWIICENWDIECFESYCCRLL